MSMDEIIENLWVGDFGAATSIELLNEAGVKYVVSCMRGKVRVHEVSPVEFGRGVGSHTSSL